jgi:hypothetical protein
MRLACRAGAPGRQRARPRARPAPGRGLARNAAAGDDRVRVGRVVVGGDAARAAHGVRRPRSPLVQPPTTPRRHALVAALASAGALETAYLTWAKAADAAVACGLGGGCGSVLDSPYAAVAGVPLPLLGERVEGCGGA